MFLPVGSSSALEADIARFKDTPIQIGTTRRPQGGKGRKAGPRPRIHMLDANPANCQ
jgi:hypothetical protein